MLKVRVGECVDTQVDQGVDGRHPSSHLLTPKREENISQAETNSRMKKGGLKSEKKMTK